MSIKKKLIAAVLAAITVGSVATTSIATAGAAQIESSVGFNVNEKDIARFIGTKVGVKMLETIYGSNALTQNVSLIMNKCFDILDKQTSTEEPVKEITLDDIKDDLQEMRNELNAGIKTIKTDIAKDTKTILNQMVNTEFAVNLGDELDSLHTQCDNIATDIHYYKYDDKERTSDEKAIEIACAIGSDSKWGNAGNPVASLKKLANLLSGGGFSDISQSVSSRDFYTVMYDFNVPNAMFSGEAYNKAKPYVDRVMLEYLYDYSVIAEGIEAVRTVADIKEGSTRYNKLSGTAKKHYQECKPSGVKNINNKIRAINDKVIDGNSPDSVISHWAIFNHKADVDSNVFINQGKSDPIAVSKELTVTKFDDKQKYQTVDNAKSNSVPQSTKDAMETAVKDAIEGSALSPENLKTLADYVSDLGDVSMTEYLKKIGIDTSSIHKSYDYYPEDAPYLYDKEWNDSKAAGYTCTFFPLETGNSTSGYNNIKYTFSNYSAINPDRKGADLADPVTVSFHKTSDRKYNHGFLDLKTSHAYSNEVLVNSWSAILTFQKTDRTVVKETTARELFKSVLPGDIDLDGKVTVKDATLIQKYLSGNCELDYNQMLNADIDGDNAVTINDATLIQKKCAGMNN